MFTTAVRAILVFSILAPTIPLASRPLDLKTGYSNRNCNEDQSTSGLSFKAVAVDPKGSLWIGGSVFGIQGLLITSRANITTASTVDSVEYIQDLSFPTVGRGWMIADGRLYHMGNGGRWIEVKSTGPTARLKSVTFINRLRGWVAGANGLVLHTTDGGVSWNAQESGTRFTLERIRFVNQLNGWAVGSDISPPETRKVLLLTTDGGQSWRKAAGSDFQQFRSVIFLNGRTGWAVNGNDELIETNDEGKTWEVRRPSDGTALESIFFLNESMGWAVGNGIIQTTDGGKTWKHRLGTSPSADNLFGEVIFANARTGLAMGLSKILITDDGGNIWRPFSNAWKAGVISKVRREKFRSP